jgi:hypothetical protein
MFISVKINDGLCVDCPVCKYRHSVVTKFCSVRREFKCKQCRMEWDVCPTKEKSDEIDSDYAELKKCTQKIAEIAKRVGLYGYQDDIQISKELLIP